MASAAAHLDTRVFSGLPTVSLTLAPLGVPLDVELVGSGDARMLAAACRQWDGTPNSTARLGLRIEAGDDEAEAGVVRITIDDAVMHVRGGGVEAAADPASRRAQGRLPARYLASPDLLRSEVLDPLVLYLLGRTDRAPVHASSFVTGDLAVLLAGPSGSGKSCLALAAAASGFPVLSEDIVYVQLCPELRVWGWPGPAHVLPANAPRGQGPFPTRLRNGKVKLAVPLAGTGDRAAASAPRAAFCLLRRGEAVSLDRLSPDEAMQGLAHLEPGFDVMAGEVRAAQAALTGNGAWQLTLSADPAEAIRFVVANIARLRDASVP
jgi:hypothetical protein